MPPKADLNKAGVESSDFPSLCNTCLGPNPYIRMSKQSLGAECKVCTRPFTVFRWLPGQGMRYKKTEVCQTCAKAKNVCQTCLLDLQFGLPTQVRDTVLGRLSKAPQSDINREYYAQNLEANQENGESGAFQFGKADSAGKELLKKLARQDPSYKRNRPHICSFYAKGSCNRGDACPYRHELPVEKGDLSHQNIKDRYHGNHDPVARKILAKHAGEAGLAPPADEDITSLFLTALPATATEDSIRQFYTAASFPANKIKSIVLVSSSKVAFVNFVNREAAEQAAGVSSVGVKVDGHDVKVQWGRSRPKKNGAAASSGSGTPTVVSEREVQSTGK
ncbi:Pre-mRNA-splicing factor ECM2 [Sporobolomyces koalae]|uniref:Pre-mRNA-splicing factor ECM2 n=1 Tax=Sporobolomyces koalae TaxID=500713 RepID=UPI003178250E